MLNRPSVARGTIRANSNRSACQLSAATTCAALVQYRKLENCRHSVSRSRSRIGARP